MNLVYAALLLNSADKEINESNLKKIVQATGAHVEEAQIKVLVVALEGVDIKEVIKNAAMPIATVPVAAAAPVAEKKEEELAEDTEKRAEEAAAGLSALFG